MCAGVRGIEIQGNFVKFTAIAVYLDPTAIPALAPNWTGKTAAELAESDDFIREIVAGNPTSILLTHIKTQLTEFKLIFVRSV